MLLANSANNIKAPPKNLGILYFSCCSDDMKLTSESGKPNVILIMLDHLGYEGIGCYVNKTINTPNLDALASNGLRYTDFHFSY